MIRFVAFAVSAVIFVVCYVPSAAAGTISGGGGGLPQCEGQGKIGGSVSVQGQCQGPSPEPPAPPPPGHPGHAIETGPGGYYWLPASGDSLSYVNCPAGEQPEYVQEYNAEGRPVGLAQVWCPGQPLPTPAPPPPPPGPQDVWNAVALPRAVVQFNPEKVGLTQLPTWFWAEGVPQVVSVSIQIGGYTITTEARPVAYMWHFGDGTSATTTNAGTATDPSVEHTYFEAGTYDVSVIIEYTGSFSYAGPNGSAGTEALTPYYSAPFVASYTVQQVRSVLVPAAAQ
jgi:hypothetical protein